MKQEVEWVKLSEREPKKSGRYIVYAPSMDKRHPFIYMAYYHKDRIWTLIPEVWANALTHWMPLPKPPKEK